MTLQKIQCTHLILNSTTSLPENLNLVVIEMYRSHTLQNQSPAYDHQAITVPQPHDLSTMLSS